MKSVAFRTRGNHSYGMGDIMGSIALARKFMKENFDILFVIDNDQEAIQVIKEGGYNFKTVKESSEKSLWGKIGLVDVVIVNMLNSSRSLLSTIKNHARYLITIDDTGSASKEFADLRINPLYYDNSALCDLKYVPLHPVFQKTHQNTLNINKKAKIILLNQGGSDTHGFIPKILSYLSKMSLNVQIKVLLGPAFRHWKNLNKAKIEIARSIEIIHNLTNKEMCNVLSITDLFIGAGGITMFEAACLGIPSIIVCGAPFEEETAQRLMDLGIVVNLGYGKYLSKTKFQSTLYGLMTNYEKRKEMSEAGRKSIDGKGTDRIYNAIVKNGRF